MLSDALHSFGSNISDADIEVLTAGCLSPPHAAQFRAFTKQIKNRYAISKIIRGEQKWPHEPENRDTLYFLAQSFRAQIIRELPSSKTKISADARSLADRAKAMIKELANISLEIAQIVVTPDDGEQLPDWFMVEIVRDLPRLAAKKG